MKKKSLLRTILFILITALLFCLLVNPKWLPFLSAETQEKISATVRQTFVVAKEDGETFFAMPKLVSFVAMIALVLCLNAILQLIIRRSAPRNKRSRTIAEMLLSILKYATVLVILVWGLTILGLNITGVLAGLGIVSLIIGFGAQSLIEDIITGMFIIVEGQYGVGDIVVVDDFRGTVRRIGVRTTVIEDAGGNIKIVNNSDIRNLQNRSENPSWAVCDVGISYGVRIETVEKVLEKGLPEIYERCKDIFLSPLTYAGVQALGESGVVLRIFGTVREKDIFSAQRRLNREIKILFDDNDVEIPFQQIVIHDGDKKA